MNILLRLRMSTYAYAYAQVKTSLKMYHMTLLPCLLFDVFID